MMISKHFIVNSRVLIDHFPPRTGEKGGGVIQQNIYPAMIPYQPRLTLERTLLRTRLLIEGREMCISETSS